MRKLLSAALYTLLYSLLFMVGVQRAEARISTTTRPSTPDAWCVYGGAARSAGAVNEGYEVCVDNSGNVTPTAATNAQTVGTSATPFYAVEATKLNPSGADLAVGATGGDTALISRFNLTKTQVGAATGATGIYVTTTVPVTSSYVVLLSSGNDLLMTSLPSISTSTVVLGSTSIDDGTILVVASTATQTITFQDEGTLTGSRLELGANTRAVTAKKVLTLIYDAVNGYWRELAYGNN